MELRVVTEVHLFALVLNPMQERTEAERVVAISTSKDALEKFYKDELVEPYKDDRWHKTFRKGGPLEWYNNCRGEMGASVIVERWDLLDHLDYWKQNFHWIEPETYT